MRGVAKEEVLVFLNASADPAVAPDQEEYTASPRAEFGGDVDITLAAEEPYKFIGATERGEGSGSRGVKGFSIFRLAWLVLSADYQKMPANVLCAKKQIP